MKKIILGTLAVFLMLALLVGSLTLIGPIHSSSAAVEHDCIVETIVVVDGRIKVLVEGALVVHDGKNHDPHHFFNCLSVL